jgi:hypothetical protein
MRVPGRRSPQTIGSPDRANQATGKKINSCKHNRLIAAEKCCAIAQYALVAPSSPQHTDAYLQKKLNHKSIRNHLGVTQLGPNWVIPTAIYGVFWPITRHMWGSLPANCVSPNHYNDNPHDRALQGLPITDDTSLPYDPRLPTPSPDEPYNIQRSRPKLCFPCDPQNSTFRPHQEPINLHMVAVSPQ